MDHDPELDRLTSVYREYRPPRSARWDPVNPGNRAILAELDRRVSVLLHREGVVARASQVLDIGCGYGHFLELLRSLGSPPETLHGIDLLPERIEYARAHHAEIAFAVGSADELPYADSSFDLVAFFSVLTSILDQRMRASIAAEAVRVLRPAGAILWYDFRYDNPWNPHVRGIGRRELARTFPDFDPELETITLLPPVARRLGRLTSALYPVLAALPPLRSHYLGVLRRAGGR
jgi:ubiquinone/menaquinone biosynthesis C-methylase UbiE